MLASRRTWIIAGAFGAAAMILGGSFGPLVRGIVAREGAKHHVDVTVGGVRPAWFAVRLLDLEARPQRSSSIRAHVDELRVGVSALLRADRIAVRGADVVLTGSPESIREDWRNLRGERCGASDGRGASTAIEAAGVSIGGVDPGAPERGAELRGIGFSRNGGGTRIVVTEGRVRFGQAGIDLGDAAGQTDASGKLVRAHASTLTIGWTTNSDA